MADLKDLLGSKKIKDFVRRGKSRPWTVVSEAESPLASHTSNEANHTPPTQVGVLSEQSAQKTEANSRPIRVQTGAKLETELRPNRVQIEAKITNQVSQEIINRGQTEAEPGTELRPLSRPIRGQTEAKLETELRPTQPISSLDGLQREILLLIFDHCKRARDKQTPPIAVQYITESCGTTYHAARKAIQRLEQKGVLTRIEFKVGRSGWTKYEIPNVSYQELLQSETEAKSRPIRGRTEDKPGTELRTEPRPSVPSSSSSIDLTTTTRNAEIDLGGSAVLEPQWTVIDYTPLAEIRFGRHQVAQIARDKRLTPEELQDSIHAFAFDLSENQKAKDISGAPLNFFMGILRRGPYAAPVNYENPEERQKRFYLEAKERQRKKRQVLEERLETVEFEEWIEKLSLEQRAAMIPPKDFAKPGGTAHNYQLREYFRENVWPEVKGRSKEGASYE